MQKQMIDAEAMVKTNKLLVSLYSMGEHNESDMGICDCKYTMTLSGSGTRCASTLPASVSRMRLGASKRQWPDSKCSGPSEVALPAVLAAAEVQDALSTLPSCSRGSLLLEAGVLLGRLWSSCTHSQHSQFSLKLLSL